MSTNLEYKKEKDREKEKVGDRPAKLNEKTESDRELEREIKAKDKFFWREQLDNLVAAVRK